MNLTRIAVNLVIVLALVAIGTSSALAKVQCSPQDSAAERLPDDGWVLVLLPDTQSYVDHSEYMPLLLVMMQWIAGQVHEMDIALVVQVGDLVYQNGITDASKGTGDQNSEQQWNNVALAFMLLDGVVPYIVVTGNHDYGIDNAQGRSTRFAEYFTPERNPLVDPTRGGILAELGPNAAGALTLENAAYDFTAPDGSQWLWLGLEWGPRQASVDWANSVASRPEYADHYIGLVTHAYMYPDETRLDFAGRRDMQSHNPHDYTGTNSDTHDGEELWQELLRPHANSRLAVCGHMGGDQTAYLASTGVDGQTVHQILFNAQFLPRGGEGWLRLLHFRPANEAGQRVDVYTYSPVSALDGNPRTSPWRTDEQDEYSFVIEPLKE